MKRLNIWLYAFFLAVLTLTISLADIGHFNDTVYYLSVVSLIYLYYLFTNDTPESNKESEGSEIKNLFKRFKQFWNDRAFVFTVIPLATVFAAPFFTSYSLVDSTKVFVLTVLQFQFIYLLYSVIQLSKNARTYILAVSFALLILFSSSSAICRPEYLLFLPHLSLSLIPDYFLEMSFLPLSLSALILQLIILTCVVAVKKVFLYNLHNN